jgi:hypothetical protein
MVDMAAIAGIATSLRAASEITQAMIGLRDATVLQGKVIELQQVILAAQSSALAAQSDHFSLMERIRGLEAEVAGFEAWERQKERYELKRYEPGKYLYELKPSMENGEPSHKICPKCYEHRKRSILHSTGTEAGVEDFKCYECSTVFTIGTKVPTPLHYPPSGGW